LAEYVTELPSQRTKVHATSWATRWLDTLGERLWLAAANALGVCVILTSHLLLATPYPWNLSASVAAVLAAWMLVNRSWPQRGAQ